jgi:hypothetical protein
LGNIHREALADQATEMDATSSIDTFAAERYHLTVVSRLALCLS